MLLRAGGGECGSSEVSSSEPGWDDVCHGVGELVGGEQFFILHIVPGHAEPTGEGMPALHGDRPRLAGLCLGAYYRRQDRPGARVLQGVRRSKKADPG